MVSGGSLPDFGRFSVLHDATLQAAEGLRTGIEGASSRGQTVSAMHVPVAAGDDVRGSDTDRGGQQHGASCGDQTLAVRARRGAQAQHEWRCAPSPLHLMEMTIGCQTGCRLCSRRADLRRNAVKIQRAPSLRRHRTHADGAELQSCLALRRLQSRPQLGRLRFRQLPVLRPVQPHAVGVPWITAPGLQLLPVHEVLHVAHHAIARRTGLFGRCIRHHQQLEPEPCHAVEQGPAADASRCQSCRLSKRGSSWRSHTSSIADRVPAAGIAPNSMDEIHAEVKAARAARRPRTWFLTPISSAHGRRPRRPLLSR